MTVHRIRESRKTRGCCLWMLLLCLLTLLSPRLAAQEKTVSYYADAASTPTDMPVKVTHLTARVAFEPEHFRVKGTAEFTVVPNRDRVDSIVFHTPDFNVSAVQCDGKDVKFRRFETVLAIYPDLPHPASHIPYPASRITIVYTAEPRAGHIYFIGWQPDEEGRRKQIWAHRPHGWIPYIEARITVDLFVTFDRAYQVFSNGERAGVTDHSDGTRTWHYAMKKDHPFFSTALVIGDYRYTGTVTRRGVPLEFWHYPDMADRVGTTYRHTEKMFDFFEQEIGINYPYPLYREAPVSDYMYGAMETTTSTVFGDYMQISPRSWWQRNYVNVNAHELAHQWFGNCVAHLVNQDVWLTESFATYYAKLFERSLYGEDFYENLRLEEMRLAFEAAQRNDYPVRSSRSGVQRIYQKGSLVLDMLRDVMGDNEFREAVRLYLERYAFNYAETGDFIRCVYDASGMPLHWFFDQWILRGGEPHYRVTDTVLRNEGVTHSVIRISQIQKQTELSGLFRMPVTFEAHYSDGSFDRVTQWIEKEYTEVVLPNPGDREVEFLLFDPGNRVLKQVTYDRPRKALLAQAAKAPHLTDRYQALVDLRSAPIETKSEVLRGCYSREAFWLTRAEILQQLALDNTPETAEIFRRALGDPDAHVRKAALTSLGKVPDFLCSRVEEMLFDSSYLNVEYALRALCSSFPGSTEYYLDVTRDMEGWRGKNIRMTWLEIALANGKTEFLAELVGYAGPLYEFETRMNALGVLKKLGYYDEQTIAYAEKAAAHWNVKLSGAAREYLKAR